MGLMEGRDAQHICGKFKDLYGQAIVANWQVWPLAQVCTSQVASIFANPSPSWLTFVSCPWHIGSRSKVHVEYFGHCIFRYSTLRKSPVQSIPDPVDISGLSENTQQDRFYSTKNTPGSA